MNWSPPLKKKLFFVTSDFLTLNYYFCYFYEFVGFFFFFFFFLGLGEGSYLSQGLSL